MHDVLAGLGCWQALDAVLRVIIPPLELCAVLAVAILALGYYAPFGDVSFRADRTVAFRSYSHYFQGSCDTFPFYGFTKFAIYPTVWTLELEAVTRQECKALASVK